MHLEITYSKVTDWGVRVWRRGTAYDGDDEELVNVQDCDAEMCFATAHVQLKTGCWNTKEAINHGKCPYIHPDAGCAGAA